MLYKSCSIKQIIFSKYANNLKTTISQRSLSNLGLRIILFKFNNISILIDIIYNTIITSLSRDQNSHQWRAVYCHVIQSETRDNNTVVFPLQYP